MGYERDTTPALDRLAGDGVVFENAIAPGPSTPESMPAIFTGQYPVARNHGDDSDDDADATSEPGAGAGAEAEAESKADLQTRRDRIRAHMNARETLPERLARMGYEMAAFTPNPFTSRHFGFDAGFDRFEDFMDESARGPLYQRLFQGFLEGSGAASLARVLANFTQREEVFKPWAAYLDDAIAWLRHASDPSFLWVFMMDVHNPYLPGTAYRTQPRWEEFYANVEFWRQSHETPFGEHGSYGHEPYLYEENVHVPLVVEGEGNGASAAVARPASLRCLPEYARAIATGEPRGSRPTGPVATTRTDDGGAVAGSDERPELCRLGRRLAARIRADDAERTRIAGAASQVRDGDGVTDLASAAASDPGRGRDRRA